jgi:hypothetical protein
LIKNEEAKETRFNFESKYNYVIANWCRQLTFAANKKKSFSLERKKWGRVEKLRKRLVRVKNFEKYQT